MSKLDIRISYKDACILKHALRDKVKINQEVIDVVEKAIDGLDERQYTVEKYKKQNRELEEEKKALERFKEQIDKFEFKHNSNMFKIETINNKSFIKTL